ncbi:MAG: outer membrane protein transport protein, partial [Chitinophagales bacterium]|nr:outer membrane protein transport protein [Chitinophagales bacterium]
RSSELSFGIGIHPGSTNSTFRNQSQSVNRNNITFNHLGFVLSVPFLKKPSISFSSSNIRFLNLAFSYNRISNFNRSIRYNGLNINNSFADAWVKELNALNGSRPDFNNASIPAVLAVKNETVFFDSVAKQYISYIRPPLVQSGEIRQSGNADEVNIALGLNVSDIVYVAVDAGIPFLSYQAVQSFSEIDAADTIRFFNDYIFREEYRSSGIGFNLKLGVIVRPVSWYRVGVAYRSPTWFRIDENYYASLKEIYNGQEFLQDVNFAPFRYRFTQPMSGIISNSFYIKQSAFFSIDYEFQNFGAIRHNFPGFQSTSESVNRIVQNKYGFSHTIRVGAEWAIKSFRLRGGYAFQSSPFKKGVGAEGYDEQRNIIGAGIGYRGRRFFAELGYQLMMYNSYFQPYESKDTFEPSVQSRNRNHQVLLSLGWRFVRR